MTKLSGSVCVLVYLILNNHMPPKLHWVITLGVLSTFYSGLVATATFPRQVLPQSRRPEFQIPTFFLFAREKSKQSVTYFSMVLILIFLDARTPTSKCWLVCKSHFLYPSCISRIGSTGLNKLLIFTGQPAGYTKGDPYTKQQEDGITERLLWAY